MERTVDVATGESVAFTYELAGLGSRFFAVFVDLAIQIGVLVLVVLVLLWLAGGAPASPAQPLSKFAGAVLDGIVTAALFLLFFGYFIVLEWRFEGRTPGKRLLGIRVVRDGGFPLDFMASLVRNSVRIVEAALGFYAVSAVCTLLSPQNRRLGDMAAGTIVVRDRRFERYHTTAAQEAGSAGSAALVHDLSGAERELIRRYADRRAGLRAEARAAVAGRIAAAVRPKLGANFGHLSDDDLLVHLATTALD